ncbi:MULTISPECIES: type II toxin-antitoxin system RelE/ParE family toxin [Chryseobacterium]|uniref:Plasmid stabilization system protein ParE n=1 Tax=Chryseobacterium camelliae TaxID=1265445 RepID=A0ABU0THM7_9FLAO|nr:plasmid stabilization system protein ParE [Chryseobacterium camelliae]MDQ1100503.1 plasmid stabilization system protein ParE [Chryseobacterium sp. SORGH_AS_1048]MDR6087843.1 plasmid stabilization system protein ParE [Chryseobacterium sp. SORGH_AS_0909]MDR6132219.1 plasmid stabilization system protein ParE [Chryseobacterium sp. SORGH_AS_1175]MDT3409577.1 plasmid stabilization system protein ParE [Pseudacidovorax intermedius]
MKIVWTDFAIENLKSIFYYYAIKANRQVAHKIRKQILDSTRQLVHNPKSGQTVLLLTIFLMQDNILLT